MPTDLPAEATPRPWHAHEQPEIDRWGHRYWWLESESEHDIGDIGKEADAALIVAAVHDYDRLLRVEAAARAYVEARDVWLNTEEDAAGFGVDEANIALRAALDPTAAGEGR